MKTPASIDTKMALASSANPTIIVAFLPINGSSKRILSSGTVFWSTHLISPLELPFLPHNCILLHPDTTARPKPLPSVRRM
uniref:Uncharacterized protein n=1 Tax=Arundo donax TaxID=35708 RepID=A0A0A8Y4X6_ARUDO